MSVNPYTTMDKVAACRSKRGLLGGGNIGIPTFEVFGPSLANTDNACSRAK